MRRELTYKLEREKESNKSDCHCKNEMRTTHSLEARRGNMSDKWRRPTAESRDNIQSGIEQGRQ